MLLQNLIEFHTVIHQIYFTKGGLADNSPKFPTTKVSLHAVYMHFLDCDLPIQLLLKLSSLDW